jgi:hypothetical protein
LMLLCCSSVLMEVGIPSERDSHSRQALGPTAGIGQLMDRHTMNSIIDDTCSVVN